MRRDQRRRRHLRRPDRLDPSNVALANGTCIIIKDQIRSDDEKRQKTDGEETCFVFGCFASRPRVYNKSRREGKMPEETTRAAVCCCCLVVVIRLFRLSFECCVALRVDLIRKTSETDEPGGPADVGTGGEFRGTDRNRFGKGAEASGRFLFLDLLVALLCSVSSWSSDMRTTKSVSDEASTFLFDTR